MKQNIYNKVRHAKKSIKTIKKNYEESNDEENDCLERKTLITDNSFSEIRDEKSTMNCTNISLDAHFSQKTTNPEPISILKNQIFVENTIRVSEKEFIREKKKKKKINLEDEEITYSGISNENNNFPVVMAKNNGDISQLEINPRKSTKSYQYDSLDKLVIIYEDRLIKNNFQIVNNSKKNYKNDSLDKLVIIYEDCLTNNNFPNFKTANKETDLTKNKKGNKCFSACSIF